MAQRNDPETDPVAASANVRLAPRTDRDVRQVSLEGYAYAPKFTPDGKRLLYQVRKGAESELWVAELDSGRSEPLLPGFAVVVTGPGSYGSYDISPEGRQVVVASPDKGGKSRLWLAPLDRRSPPRQIPNIEGEQPVFGATGEVFFRGVEGTSSFLYRVQEDGGELRKAFDVPIVGLSGESPGRNWLALGSGGDGYFPGRWRRSASNADPGLFNDAQLVRGREAFVCAR